jgi:glycosyltransferase involved in cell wall biosynthesis
MLVKVGSMSRSSKELIERLEINKKVISFEFCHPAILAYFYNASDMLVFPSCYEGFGIPPLEAMSSGCPVITAARTSIPEVVGEAAIRVSDPFDVDAFCEEMCRVLEDNKLARKLTETGLERARLFSWKKAAREHLRVYDEILANE